MTTLKQLHEQRAAIEKEIKEREEGLVQLSFQNLGIDLDHRVDPSMTVESLANLAASMGLALTTTSDRATDIFKSKYATDGSTLTDAAKRIVEKMS